MAAHLSSRPPRSAAMAACSSRQWSDRIRATSSAVVTRLRLVLGAMVAQRFGIGHASRLGLHTGLRASAPRRRPGPSSSDCAAQSVLGVVAISGGVFELSQGERARPHAPGRRLRRADGERPARPPAIVRVLRTPAKALAARPDELARMPGRLRRAASARSGMFNRSRYRRARSSKTRRRRLFSGAAARSCSMVAAASCHD